MFQNYLKYCTFSRFLSIMGELKAVEIFNKATVTDEYLRKVTRPIFFATRTFMSFYQWLFLLPLLLLLARYRGGEALLCEYQQHGHQRPDVLQFLFGLVLISVLIFITEAVGTLVISNQSSGGS